MHVAATDDSMVFSAESARVGLNVQLTPFWQQSLRQPPRENTHKTNREANHS